MQDQNRVRGGLRYPRVLIVVGAVALVALAVGIAKAAIPDSGTGEIHGCYQKNQGQLRVIDAQAGATCGPSELGLVWNQIGPTGPSGPSGPSGPRVRRAPGDRATASRASTTPRCRRRTLRRRGCSS